MEGNPDSEQWLSGQLFSNPVRRDPPEWPLGEASFRMLQESLLLKLREEQQKTRSGICRVSTDEVAAFHLLIPEGPRRWPDDSCLGYVGNSCTGEQVDGWLLSSPWTVRLYSIFPALGGRCPKTTSRGLQPGEIWMNKESESNVYLPTIKN